MGLGGMQHLHVPAIYKMYLSINCSGLGRTDHSLEMKYEPPPSVIGP